jgi:dipeptidyl aminopeptidase/acylaminoacyl peptidase
MPDARVQAAVDHWGPRFIQAGVDANDFARTTARVETWDEWLGAWCDTASSHEALAREAEARGRTVTAGEAWLRAAVCFHFGKFVWVLDEARARQAADRAVAALREAHRLLDPDAERVEAELDGGTIVANLRRPRGASRPPLVVLIAGLDSTKEEFFLLENLFHARGMATLSLDGPGQGEGGYELPLRHDFEVGVAAILDAVHGFDRVGALGVSLGGYYAPRAAAFEPRISAVAGISGPFDFGAIWDHLPPLTRETFVRKSHAADEEDGRRRASALNLDGVVEQLDKPALFVTGKLDRLIPWEQTRRAADGARQGEFVIFEDGNHVCANVPYKARPLVADWLREKLT